MFTLRDLEKVFVSQQGWVLLTGLLATVYKLGESHASTADAHSSHADTARYVTDAVLSGNQTLINLMLQDMQETQAHCESEAKHCDSLSQNVKMVAGVLVPVAATAVCFGIYYYRKIGQQEYQRVSLNDNDNNTKSKFCPKFCSGE